MAPLLLTVTGALALLVVALIVLVLRMRARLEVLERRATSPAATELPEAAADTSSASLEERGRPTEFVITGLGEPEPEPAPTVPAPVFADLVLKETVVQTASLFHGVRRALAPETRNRIRFHMRQEVKRSRKQRRSELREVRREWQARQREGLVVEEPAA